MSFNPAEGALSDETIAAISTSQGRAAIGVIRISGPRTCDILDKFCISKSGSVLHRNPRKSFLCDFKDGDGEILDEGLAVFFSAPGSYTGEDVAELSFHGSPLILRNFLHAITREPGVRPALPGEFTRRAFMNNKLDLTKAESIARLIDSKSDYELKAVRKIYSGELSRLVNRMRSALISLKAEIEAGVDFSTEDLTLDTKEGMVQKVALLMREIDLIIQKNSASSRVSSGLRIALVGSPNAGKSSLLNLLTGKDRAIVTPIAGTTRDFIIEEMEIDGVPVRFIDTAGLRVTEDEIEREGIRRSKKEIGLSDLVLHVIDIADTTDNFDRVLIEQTEIPHNASIIRVMNKADLIDFSRVGKLIADEWPEIQISCVIGRGLDDLMLAIRNYIFSEPEAKDPFLVEDRHLFHFRRIRDSLQRLTELWSRNAPDEICAIEADQCIDHIGQITGSVSTEEILGRIFSTFCVGK
jgi:tRNA modification GTPase